MDPITIAAVILVTAMLAGQQWRMIQRMKAARKMRDRVKRYTR